jgi:Na+-transporting NADH:ubiquinone oxidoreductase subunit C
MKKDGPVYTIVFSFVVCAVFVFGLALANWLTADRTAANRRLAERSAVLAALGVAVPAPAGGAADSAAVDAAYEEAVTESRAGDLTVFKAAADGGPRYAAYFSGPGLWGTITGVLAVDAAVDRIVGLRFVAQNETPGLGGRIDEPWFAAQFAGEKLDAAGRIAVRPGAGTGDRDPDNSAVDAVTGASRTSDAVQRLVNDLVAAFRRLKDEGVLP